MIALNFILAGINLGAYAVTGDNWFLWCGALCACGGYICVLIRHYCK